jgi:hypothetical protein
VFPVGNTSIGVSPLWRSPRFHRGSLSPLEGNQIISPKPPNPHPDGYRDASLVLFQAKICSTPLYRRSLFLCPTKSLRPPLFACALRNHEVISRTKVPEILCISRGKQALGGSNLGIATLLSVARNDVFFEFCPPGRSPSRARR